MPIGSLSSINRDQTIALSNIDFSKQIVAVKKEEIVILSKSDITFFQLFLRLFNRGKLAHMQWDLSNVSTHLSKFDWQSGSKSEKSSDDYKAYLKVCVLANKALYSRNETALIEKVAEQTLNKYVTVEFYMSQKGNRADILQNGQLQPLQINPEMQMKHIEALLKKQNQARKIVISGFNANENITSDRLAQARISIPVEPRWFRCLDSWNQRGSEIVGMDELD